MGYLIQPASNQNVPTLMALRTEAEDWLTSLGSDQWSDRETGTRAISKWQDAISEGRTWVIRSQKTNAIVATVSRGGADSDFWRQTDDPETGLYLYKLIVSRTASGLGIGDLVLDWACRVAQLEGRTWLRIDCWRTATGLQRYYQRRGFTHVRTEAPEHRRSGWLAQRPATLLLNDKEIIQPVMVHTAQSAA
jgi:ribosomal protein S18 acetylase RimI-like enzyme